MQSQIIKQKYKADCAICCIAMATGLDYEDVVKGAGDLFDPWVGTVSIHKVLKQLNIPYREAQKLTPGNRALVSYLVRIDALTGLSLCHMVYYNGEEFLDPAKNPKKHPLMIRVLEL